MLVNFSMGASTPTAARTIWYSAVMRSRKIWRISLSSWFSPANRCRLRRNCDGVLSPNFSTWRSWNSFFFFWDVDVLLMSNLWDRQMKFCFLATDLRLKSHTPTPTGRKIKPPMSSLGLARCHRYLFFLFIRLSSSLVHFLKVPEYFTRRIAQMFIPFMRFSLESFQEAFFFFFFFFLGCTFYFIQSLYSQRPRCLRGKIC